MNTPIYQRLAQPHLLQSNRYHLSVLSRLGDLHWGLIFFVCVVAAIGCALLYSAAGGKLEPWAQQQIIRFGVALAIMFGVALSNLRFWMRYAYLVYAIGILLLVAVELIGLGGGGAQRWIALGPIRVQPSEVMKIALVIALARYFHKLDFEDVGRLRSLIIPVFLIALPAALVLRQPDLGTAVILCAVGGVVFFLAGVRWWKFAIAGAGAAALIPIAWSFLRPYQKQRLYSFIDPNTDPLGTGYHIIQSKIALGSGGIWGKGYMQGTQIHLDFLPEIHTDFIFSVLAEEFGIAGGIALLLIYGLILYFGISVSLRSRNQFGRLIAMGVTFTFFLYIFINMGMVMGLLPVVGVPLPLVSYGGTSMMTLMFGIGLILSVHVHREIKIGRYGDDD